MRTQQSRLDFTANSMNEGKGTGNVRVANDDHLFEVIKERSRATKIDHLLKDLKSRSYRNDPHYRVIRGSPIVFRLLMESSSSCK